MREKLLKLANVDSPMNNNEPRLIIIITRSNSPYTNNISDYLRWWYYKVLDQVLNRLKILFKNHRVFLYSDQDTKMMECPSCQIKLFQQADILLSFHGAGK